MLHERFFRKQQKILTWLKKSGFPSISTGADSAAVVHINGGVDNYGGADLVELIFHHLDLRVVYFLRVGGPAEFWFWVVPL